MEIQDRLFSEYDGETFYSVTMNEDEYYLYSEFQKEFNIVGDIYHSGLGRTAKKYIGKARKSVTKYIDKSISKDISKLSDASTSALERMTGSELRVLNKEGRKKLYQKAHELGAKSRGIPNSLLGQGSSSTMSTTIPQLKEAAKGKLSLLGSQGEKELNRAVKQGGSHPLFGPSLSATEAKKTKKRVRKLTRDINESRTDNIISHEAKAGDSVLSHEIGHIGNKKEGGVISKKISKVANDPSVRGEINLLNGSNIYKVEGNPLKKFLEGKAVVAEERNASKRGIKYMKEAGYSPEEIKKNKTCYAR